MNINGGFFSDTEGDALREMQKMVKCKVKRCAYPTTKNLTYYLSEHGDLFSIQKIQGKLLTRGPKKPGTKSKNGTTLRLSNGRHGAGSESWIPAELLVYCTFILGRWEPDLRIDFKNGKASDIRPDNLQEHVEEIPPEWAENLKQYCGIYDDWFNEIVIRVMWWCGLSKEDAKDVTSQTFLWLCTDGYKDVMNFRLWIYWAKLRGYDFKRHHSDHYNTEDYDLILELRGTKPPTYEVDMIHIQKGDRRQRFLELWAQGHTPTEIAEMEGSTVGNVGSSVTRSIQFLQKYFAHDKEMFRRRQTADAQ
jgi:DNA-directed RNA polymerase specialized sigma24 family protein